MIVHEPWHIPILEFDLDIDNTELLKFALDQEASVPSVSKSNGGGYQTPFLDLQEPTLLDLIQSIEHQFVEHAEALIFPPPYTITTMWCNINYYKDFNWPHRHPLSTFSGVYYVQAPENCGRIQLEHPSLDILHHYPRSNGVDATHDAAFNCAALERRLYIFPSWLKHCVEPNMNKNEKRISFSFNLSGDIS